VSFTCPACKIVSHNPMDERERYCGRCRVFFAAEDPPSKAVTMLLHPRCRRCSSGHVKLLHFSLTTDHVPVWQCHTCSKTWTWVP
jgi:hypothetical protein